MTPDSPTQHPFAPATQRALITIATRPLKAALRDAIAACDAFAADPHPKNLTALVSAANRARALLESFK